MIMGNNLTESSNDVFFADFENTMCELYSVTKHKDLSIELDNTLDSEKIEAHRKGDNSITVSCEGDYLIFTNSKLEELKIKGKII